MNDTDKKPKPYKKYVQIILGLMIIFGAINLMAPLIMWAHPQAEQETDWFKTLYFFFLVFLLVFGLLQIHFGFKNFGFQTTKKLISVWGLIIVSAWMLFTALSMLL